MRSYKIKNDDNGDFEGQLLMVTVAENQKVFDFEKREVINFLKFIKII